MSGWRFQPRRWPTLAAWLLILGFGFLAHWQWRAAWQSEARLRTLQTSRGNRPEPWSPGLAAAPFERLSVRGRYLRNRDLLLIDLYHHDQIGSQIVSVFRPRSSPVWIPVDRGWIPTSPLGVTRTALDRQLPRGSVELVGYAGRIPRPALRLGRGPVPPHWPKPVLYPSHRYLETLYRHRLTRLVLLLGPRQPGGFVRQWRPVRKIGPEQHFGYALQWLILALVVLGVWIGLNLHRKSPP
jgi:cytochrome oxidase assembly protein ShyY1